MITKEKLEEELKSATELRDTKTQQYQELQKQIQLAQENSNRLALEVNALNEKIKTLKLVAE